MNTVTFSGEKLLGIFSQHSVFSRNFPQQFNDQCYVICIGKHCQQNRNTRQFNQYTACRHCHCPRRQKQSATSTIKGTSCAHAAWRRAPSSWGHHGWRSRCTGRPRHRAKLGLPPQLLNEHRNSAGLLFEFRRNAFVTIIAAISSCYSVSVCIVRFSKRRGTTSAIEEFPRIFSR